MDEDDIVERLRYHTATLDRPLCMEAASEIEQLRNELKAWRDRFPMCHYDPDAGSIFSDSAPH
jgi:hypothetical protein